MVDDPSQDRRGAVIYGSIEPLRSPTVLALHAYWRSKQRGRPMPAPSEIDPAEIRPLLPSLIIAEYVPALLEGNSFLDLVFPERVFRQPVGRMRLGQLLDFHLDRLEAKLDEKGWRYP